MASLANQTISSTYDGLVKTATDQPVGVSGVQLLEDGVGNSLALSVGRANQGVTVTGTLTATTVTGTLSATSVLADGVIATTQATSDNSTKVATTAFVKSVVTAEDLDIAGDTGTGAVDLDSQTLTISGTANEIETSASGQTITIGLPSTITANVTGDVSGNLTGNVTGNVSGNVTGDLTGTVLTAAQTNITSVGTLSSLAVSGASTLGGVVKATTQGNTNSTGGTFMIGNQNNNAEKWGVLTSTHYNSDSEPEGFALISGISFDSGGINNLIRIGGGVNETNAAGSIEFYTGATSSTRAGTVSATINVNGISFPNGKGIDFSAVAGGGATSSLLDDYEEGTWTPDFQSAGGSGAPTIFSRTGIYTKIGRQVFCNFVISFTKNTLSGGTLQMTGFPFTSIALSECTILIDNLATALNNPLLQMGNGVSLADFVQDNGSTGNHAGLSIDTYLGAGTVAIRGTLTYFT